MVNRKLTIAMVAAERVPLVKVGGLADVVGALSDTLAERGHTVQCWLPAYGSIQIPAGATRTRLGERFAVPFGHGSEWACLERVDLADSRTEIYLVQHLGDSDFFSRDGIYGDPDQGDDYPDNPERFLFFSRAVCEGMKRLGRPIDVVHLNDNQTAFIAAMLRRHYVEDPILSRAGILFSLHNVGYQGIYPARVLELAQIPAEEFYPGSSYEYYDQVNFLKVGITHSDILTTVSERYAEEICAGSQYGFGLEGVLEERSADLRGILNGIDYRVWDPTKDLHLPARYSIGDLSGKQECKNWLMKEAGWPIDSDWPIVGIIARLVEQKGLDLIREAAPRLLQMEARFFFLGTGQEEYEEWIQELARAHPDRVQAHIGFDEVLAHRVEGGADLLLMPSRYEPCGLNQLISLRYGTVPVVRSTGGLADTVRDFDPHSREGTGFVFQPYEPSAMIAAIKRALALYRQPRVWNALVANGMAQDFSWEVAATAYESAYRDALFVAQKRGEPNATQSVG